MKNVVLGLIIALFLSATLASAQTRPDWLDVKGKSFIDVRDYGAKGDDAIDDTDEIQAALVAAGGTKAVLIADGNFIVSTLSPLSNTIIFGNATLTHAGTETTDTCNIFDLSGTTGVSIDGLTLDAKGHLRTRVVGTSPTIVGGDTVTDATITHVTFRNALTTAIEMARAYRLLISECRFINTQEHAIYVSTGTKGYKVVNCEFRNVGLQPGLVTPQPCVRGRLGVSDVLVSGCSYEVDTPAILPIGATPLTRFAEFSDSGTPSEPCHNVTIVNNTGTDLTEGIVVMNPYTVITATNTISNLIISGNRMIAKPTSSTYGIIIGKVTGAKVSDNFIMGFNYGLYVGGYNDLQIHNNTIEGPEDAISSVDGISVIHTLFNGTDGSMISRKLSVVDNNVRGFHRYALFMQHVATEVHIRGNNLYSTFDRALQVEPFDSATSSDLTGSATYWITNNYLATGLVTGKVAYLNNSNPIDVRVFFLNNQVVNPAASHQTFISFNGSETYYIAGNIWCGGDQSFTVSPEARAYIVNNTGDFDVDDLAAAVHSASGTVIIGPNNIPGARVLYGFSAAPATGTWAIGDRAYNVAATDTADVGWVCGSAGTPGVWTAFK